MLGEVERGLSFPNTRIWPEIESKASALKECFVGR